MNSVAVSTVASCSPRNVRKKTKQALERSESIVRVKGLVFLFEEVYDGRGKSYEYTLMEDIDENAGFYGRRVATDIDIHSNGNGDDSSNVGGYVNENTSRWHKEDDGATKQGAKNRSKKSQEAGARSGDASAVCAGQQLERGDKDSDADFGKKKRSSVEEKKEVVAYAKMHGATTASKFFNVPINTVYRWIKAFDKKGSRALQDKRGGVVRADMQKIKEAMFAGGTMCATSWWKIYCRIWAEENGEVFDAVEPKADISRATFLRHASRIKSQDKTMREYLLKGLDGLNVRPTAIRDYLGFNEEWQIDATPFDFMALDENGVPKRYTAIAMVDVGSSRRVWELAESPNSYANVRLLKKALQKMGRPDYIKGDNGKDYAGTHFQGVLDRLGITYIFAQPFRGDQKGKVERGFGVNQKELEMLPGFIGHNVGQRSQKEAQAVGKAQRLSGVKTNIKNLLTKDELQAYIDDYFERKYFKEASDSVSAQFDMNVLGKSASRQLHAQGFSINGVYYVSLDVFRNAKIGERLEVIEDIDDLSIYHVYRDGEYLTDVYNNEVTNYTAEEWKAVQKEYASKHTRAQKALAKLMQNTKDELFKEDARRLEQKRKNIRAKEKKELAKKDDTQEVIKISKENKTIYRPKFPDMEELLG